MCLSAAYKRVLLKLSGEVLAGENKMGFDFSVVNKVCQTVKRCADMGVQVAIVIGGGNFWRGRSSGDMDRTRADHMGMLATVINSLALCDELEKLGTKAKVLSAISMPQIADLYTKRDAVAALENGEVVIFGCGTGSPFFSTDTTAALRAAEIGADIIFKATNVDGVYDSDPKKNPNAVKYDSLEFIDVLKQGLHVMDSTAASLCMDNNIPVLVFNLNDTENIIRAIEGRTVGTIVK
ncbi:MAG: UMP kinase [Clostridia bacterium]|nr:UMP kinase [Clostridia bacterium]MEE1278417.1 UMP kinase [Acutalibacteraceae bacterium]